VKPVLTTWLLMLGLLLQSVAWALPVERAGQAERLAHKVAHAIDHGHHQHPDARDRLGHDVDPSLLMVDKPHHGEHGPHHFHAAEGVQFQGLPVSSAVPPLSLPAGSPSASVDVLPVSTDPDGLLRPPRATA
jgi:hypothetical protein